MIRGTQMASCDRLKRAASASMSARCAVTTSNCPETSPLAQVLTNARGTRREKPSEALLPARTACLAPSNHRATTVLPHTPIDWSRAREIGTPAVKSV